MARAVSYRDSRHTWVALIFRFLVGTQPKYGRECLRSSREQRPFRDADRNRNSSRAAKAGKTGCCLSDSARARPDRVYEIVVAFKLFANCGQAHSSVRLPSICARNSSSRKELGHTTAPIAPPIRAIY